MLVKYHTVKFSKYPYFTDKEYYLPYDNLIYMYLLTAIGLTTGGSSTVHIYTQKIHRTTQ